MLKPYLKLNNLQGPYFFYLENVNKNSKALVLKSAYI